MKSQLLAIMKRLPPQGRRKLVKDLQEVINLISCDDKKLRHGRSRASNSKSNLLPCFFVEN
jgi:hypothetical protein